MLCSSSTLITCTTARRFAGGALVGRPLTPWTIHHPSCMALRQVRLAGAWASCCTCTCSDLQAIYISARARWRLGRRPSSNACMADMYNASRWLASCTGLRRNGHFFQAKKTLGFLGLISSTDEGFVYISGVLNRLRLRLQLMGELASEDRSRRPRLLKLGLFYFDDTRYDMAHPP